MLGFFRPGPYVYAETTDLGLPKWFSQKYRNAHVKGYQDGKYVDVGMKNNVAHNHPDFIRAAERWYKAVCGEIQDYLAPKGNIVMFQLCNEIPTEDLKSGKSGDRPGGRTLSPLFDREVWAGQPAEPVL